MNQLTNPRRDRRMPVIAACLLLGLAGCTATTTTGSQAPTSNAPAASGALAIPSVALPAIPAPSATPSPVASATEASSAPASLEPTAVPIAIDPCQFLPVDEASTLAGVQFQAGKASTIAGNTKVCTYGGNTKNVFMVEIAQAPDTATAQAEKQDVEAALKSSATDLGTNGLTVTKLSDFASDAEADMLEATLKVAGQTIGGRGIAVLRGPTFFGFSDLVLDGPPPSAADVEAEATTLLGRLP